MNPHPPQQGPPCEPPPAPPRPHVNTHPSLTRLNSRQVQTGPQFQAVLGSHALLRPIFGVHMPSCAPPPGVHIRPATWVHMPSCAPPPGVHMPSCPPAPRHLGSHALLPSSAPPPGVHMPSSAPPPGFTCPPAPRHLGSHVEPDHTRGSGVSGRRGGWGAGHSRVTAGGGGRADSTQGTSEHKRTKPHCLGAHEPANPKPYRP